MTSEGATNVMLQHSTEATGRHRLSGRGNRKRAAAQPKQSPSAVHRRRAAESADTKDPRLKPAERAVAVVCGLAAAAAAIFLFLHPAIQKVTERNDKGTATKTTESLQQHTEYVLLLLAAAGGFLLWGTNGLRLTKFTVGGVSGELDTTPAEKAKAFAKDPRIHVVGSSQKAAKRSQAVPDGASAHLMLAAREGSWESLPVSDLLASLASPEPSAKPNSIVAINTDAVGIYSLRDVPGRLLADALTVWPTELLGPPPHDLSTFEFAGRPTDPEEHWWIVKFRDAPAIRIPYSK